MCVCVCMFVCSVQLLSHRRHIKHAHIFDAYACVQSTYVYMCGVYVCVCVLLPYQTEFSHDTCVYLFEQRAGTYVYVCVSECVCVRIGVCMYVSVCELEYKTKQNVVKCMYTYVCVHVRDKSTYIMYVHVHVCVYMCTQHTRLLAAVIACISPVRCKLKSSMGTTCE